MKNLLLLTLAIATLTSLVYSQNSPTKKNGWETDNLKGKVKSYTQSKYGAEDRFGEIQKKALDSFKTFEYTVKGSRIKSTHYDANGRIEGAWIYKYDAKGNLIEWATYNADGSLSSRQTFKYNVNSDLTEHNLYKKNIDYPDGSFYKEGISQYDNNGNKIKYTHYDVDGSILETWAYIYDAKGNLIEEHEYDSYFDTMMYGLGPPYTLYKYNDNGNLTEREHHSGIWTDKQILVYDDSGNLIEEKNQTSIGQMDTYYEYEFDEKGNWIKRITFKNQIPESIEERKYEYYE